MVSFVRRSKPTNELAYLDHQSFPLKVLSNLRRLIQTLKEFIIPFQKVPNFKEFMLPSEKVSNSKTLITLGGDLEKACEVKQKITSVVNKQNVRGISGVGLNRSDDGFFVVIHLSNEFSKRFIGNIPNEIDGIPIHIRNVGKPELLGI